MDKLLQSIREFAEKAHGDQRRKFVDEPYINHPLRVMETCRQYSPSSSMAAAAILHDVLEDTPVTGEEFREFLSTVMDHSHAGHTFRLVRDLTDTFTHARYPNWNRRKRKQKEYERLAHAHPDAQTIKYADIMDNSVDVAGSGDEFARIYLNECKTLLAFITKGVPELHKIAVETVDKALVSLGSSLRLQ